MNLPKVPLALLWVIASVSGALAEELLPAIVPLEARHRAEIRRILERADAATGAARDVYLAALARAQKEQVAKGDAGMVATIDLERKTAETDMLEDEPPASLPKKLHAPRKAAMRAMEKFEEELERASKKANESYAAALRGIPGSADNPALAKQIEAERKRLLFGAGVVRNLQTDLPGTRWRRVDDPKKLHTFTTDHKWEGHKFTTPGPTEVTIQFNQGGSVTLKLAEGGNVLLGEDGLPNMTLVRGVVR